MFRIDSSNVLGKIGAGLDPDIIYTVSTGLIERFIKQPREYFDEEKLDSLRASIDIDGQKEEGTICLNYNLRKITVAGPPFLLVDGERRFRCCVASMRHFRAKVNLQIKDERTHRRIAAIHSHNKEALSLLERIKNVRDLKRDGLTWKEVARIAGITEVTAQTYYNASCCAPEILKRLHPKTEKKDRISLKVAATLGRITDFKQQLEMLPGLMSLPAVLAERQIAQTVEERQIPTKTAMRTARVIKRQPSDEVRSLERSLASALRAAQMAERILAGSQDPKRLFELRGLETNARTIQFANDCQCAMARLDGKIKSLLPDSQRSKIS